jgi:hypothetical protein
VECGRDDAEPTLLKTGTHLFKAEKERLNSKSRTGQCEEIAYDGQSTRFMCFSTLPGNNIKEGWVRNRRYPIAKPAAYARGATARLVWERSLLDVLEKGSVGDRVAVESYDGQECCVLDGSVAPGFRFRLWLDPACGFMPRRIEEWVGLSDKPVLKTVMSQYVIEQVAPGIWLPTGVTRSQADPAPGERPIFTRSTFRVISINSDLPDEMFAIRFPRGTSVLVFGETDNPRDGTEFTAT